MHLYDAIVIGAGHNGLVCAAYLARAGLGVAVVEATDRIGGACVTEELWPGFRMSTASYSLSLLLPEIVHDLGLHLDVAVKEPSLFAPHPDGGGLVLWRDTARRHAALAEYSPKDADAYERFEDLWEDAARIYRPLLTYPATRKQVRRAFRKATREKLFDIAVEGSIAAVCEEHFESEFVSGALASQGITGSSAGPRTPGTAYVYLHHRFGEAAGESGAWGFVRGGMGAITSELADVVRAAGGDIRAGTPVTELKTDGRRRASGVVLEGGEELNAPVVVSNAHPARMVALVPDGALPPEFVEDVELLPTEGTVVKVNCALSGLPRFRGMSGNGVGPEHTGTIAIAPSIDYLERSCAEAAAGRVADELFCEAWIQTATEPELAPDGKHTLSVFAQYVPHRFADGTWDERRDEVGDVVLATLERYAPGVTGLVDERMVLGPPDLEARFGLVGGNIFHGEILPDWMFDKRPATGWHRHRAPLPGLYMCGSGTHPGGGVTGAPGLNAARAVLSDLVAAGGTLPGPSLD